jgi:hypothetical protein
MLADMPQLRNPQVGVQTTPIDKEHWQAWIGRLALCGALDYPRICRRRGGRLVEMPEILAVASKQDGDAG